MKKSILYILFALFSLSAAVSLTACKDDGVEISGANKSKTPKNVKLLEYGATSLTICWDFIRGAIAAGADTYVSGRLSYNTMAEAAEMGITLVEAGHFYTENIICAYYLRLLAALGIPGACYDSNRIEIV